MSIKKISKLQPETFAFSKDNLQDAEKEIKNSVNLGELIISDVILRIAVAARK